ncbi:hypothetical protein NQZ68_021110 [Dissostichus eleginoides]|nr:hypothetical protein NQZ68_021110 [Dissostichus eleginoides]
MAARLPASIFTGGGGGVRCAATRLYGLPFRECSNSPTYPRRSICDHATTPPPPNGTTAGVALSNDDLINGDTLLAVDGMRCPLTRSFQRLSAPAEEFLFLFHTKSCSMLQEVTQKALTQRMTCSG